VHICPLVPALGKGTPRQLPRFQAALTGIDLGNGLSLADLRMTDPVGAVRSRRLAAATPRDDLLVFCVHLAGSARVTQHERVAETTSGDGVLYDGRNPLELAFPATCVACRSSSPATCCRCTRTP
jgi:AraC-binding-like domain